MEFGLQLFFEHIKENILNSKIDIKDTDDIITIFFDSSGSRIIKNKGIILAKINDQILFEIISGSNYMNSYEFVEAIKNTLKIPNKTKIVFVTDGDIMFVDPIKDYFPDAIHIRQFHKTNSRGLIYIHLKHDSKDYTIRCLWDLVLNEGKPSEKTIKMRERKERVRLQCKERALGTPKAEYSELSKEIIVWEGTIYCPRGKRKRIRNKTKKEEKTIREIKGGKHDEVITLRCDAAKLIYRGNLEEALKIDVMGLCFDIIKKIFAGVYITSNIVETLFNFKSQFSAHRTIKNGERLLICVIYNYTKLKEKTKEELVEFFRQVVTYNDVMKFVLSGTGTQKNKESEIPDHAEMINSAIESGKRLYMHYRNRFYKHSARLITPKRLIKNEYNSQLSLEAFCHKRNEERTFYLERIRDLSEADAFTHYVF